MRKAKFHDLPAQSVNKRTGKDNQYIYFLAVGDPSERVFKIGTTNRPRERMMEHERAYKKPVSVIWLSPPLSSKWTTLKVEEKMKDDWIAGKPWKYLRNDRFVIPESVSEVVITIKKDYTIPIPGRA